MDRLTYEINTSHGSHAIESKHVLVCADTGRVVAVFYNDYDLEGIIEQLENNKDKG